MQIVIDIPGELKQKIDEGFTNQVIINKLWDATRNGTVLPEHGRLFYADTLVDGKYTHIIPIDNAPTILEATKGV